MPVGANRSPGPAASWRWVATGTTPSATSARAAGGEHILMKPNGLGLEEVTPGDVLALDLEGAKLSGAGPIHLEYVLHTEIYKARPDVGAVVHTHPPYATAFGATDATLELLNHDAVLFREGLAYFDDTAELIVRPEQGAAVAAALGDRRVLVMRGHGLIVTGETVPWATYAALTLERVLQIQSIARSLGNLLPMSPRWPTGSTRRSTGTIILPSTGTTSCARCAPGSRPGCRGRVMTVLDRFTIHQPQSVAEASAMLARFGPDAAIYAGGTELLIVMKERLAHFPHLIDIKRIPGLKEIDFDAERRELSIGAVATHRDLERSLVVRERFPALGIRKRPSPTSGCAMPARSAATSASPSRTVTRRRC